MKRGDRVRHPLAGTGTVRRLMGRSVKVLWDKRGLGIAYTQDCKIIHKTQSNPLPEPK
jgi:hypothetical protein